jgi:hypothetical protein
MRQTNKITRHWRREMSKDVVLFYCSYEVILLTCSYFMSPIIFSLSHLLTYIEKDKTSEYNYLISCI